MTGGEALARMLAAHRVGPMFGMGGFQLLPFYDAVRRLGLQHHLINDERAGAFAADAYARVTGRVGVCDATLGPGATNLVTALVESLNAGVPVIALIGDTHRAHSWKNMTQESRQLEILRPAVKDVLRVERIERIPELIRRAFTLATTGRPGPVVVDVPEDVAHDTHGFDEGELAADDTYTRIPALRCRPAADMRDQSGRHAGGRRTAADSGRWRRPSVGRGGPIAGLRRIAFAIPVAHTLSGKGAIACTHPLSAGIFGRYDPHRQRADRSIRLPAGGRLQARRDRDQALRPAPARQAADPSRHCRRRDRPLLSPDLGPVGRCTRRNRGLARSLVRSSRADPRPAPTTRPRSRERMAAWRQSVEQKLTSAEVPVTMGRLMHELNQLMPKDGVLIADGGFAAHWGGLLFDTKRAGRTFVPDRGFASIGYGLPAAIGARLGAPKRTVLALTGDAGFNMTMGELETAKRLGLGFTLIIVNNAASGYVKALQHMMYGEGAYQSSDLVETDYAAAARALGCHGIRVEQPDALAGALRDAMAATDRPAVIDVVVTRDPAQMLPGVDSRAAQAKPGDRVA